jgi:hypothetical protein
MPAMKISLLFLLVCLTQLSGCDSHAASAQQAQRQPSSVEITEFAGARSLNANLDTFTQSMNRLAQALAGLNCGEAP